mgnify:CR=1 FL=1
MNTLNYQGINDNMSLKLKEYTIRKYPDTFVAVWKANGILFSRSFRYNNVGMLLSYSRTDDTWSEDTPNLNATILQEDIL